MEPLESLDPLFLLAAKYGAFDFRVEGNDGRRDVFGAGKAMGSFTAALVFDEIGPPKSTEDLLLTGADDEGVTV